MQNHPDIYLPFDAKIIEREQMTPDVFKLTVQFTDPQVQQHFSFAPGQFNMLHLFGVGEVAISIVSDPAIEHLHSHTIRRVGRVTHGLSLLQQGDHIGIRGPFGRGWPLKQAQHKDVLIITGGLGCAPSVSIINYIVKRRKEFGRLIILQGVKHSDDFIFRQQYEQWQQLPDTQVMLAADVSKASWHGFTGLVVDLIDQVDININNTICMMCGPEVMMRAAVERLKKLKFPIEAIYLSLERNMECAVGHCGHCQFGGQFICKDGPVFCYPDIAALFGKKGF